jgi:hypothetical protein
LDPNDHYDSQPILPVDSTWDFVERRLTEILGHTMAPNG